jgi:predicted outer membrane repeat protein
MKIKAMIKFGILFSCVKLAIVFICACDGSNVSSSMPKHSYGALSLKIDIIPASIDADRDTYRKANITAPDICADYGIDTIAMEVLGPNGYSIADASWECFRHNGIIENVPTGSDYTVIGIGIVRSQHKWQGEVEQVNVADGQTTDIGILAMHYTGDDNTAPSLSYSSPADGENDVVLNTSIVAAFDDNLAASSIPDQAITVSTGDNPIPGQIVFHPGNSALYFQPAEALQPLTNYSVTIDSSLPDGAGITDAAGNVCGQDYQWNFLTGDSMDSQVPQIASTLPVAGAESVDPYAPISATFNESLNPAALNEGLFTVSSGQTTVAGRISYDHSTRTLIFTPDTPLAYLTDYEAKVRAGVMDMAQNPMPEPSLIWTFRTMKTQYSLSVIKQGSGAGTITSVPAGIDCGSLCEARFYEGADISLQAVPDENSNFEAWTGHSCSATQCNITIQQDTTLTATFTVKSHTINADSTPGGRIKPAGRVLVDNDKGISFELTSNEGYYLADLQVDGVSHRPYSIYEFVQVREDHTIQAIFKPKTLVDYQVSASGNGRTWDTAFKSIQEAISQTNPGGEIWMSEGIYPVSAPIVVNKNLTIRGGFNKTETFLEDRSPDRRTTIDGNKTVGCMRVTAEVSIDNLIFDNGTSAKGGGLNCTAEVTLENTTFSNCTADDGGGIYSNQRLNMTNCEFINDQALTGSGGAIFIQGTESNRAGLSLIDCRFEDNISWYDQYHEGGLYGGGAIFSNYSDAMIISDSNFKNNRAFHGGAIYMVNGDTASIQTCRFDNNNAREPAGMGGAIYNKDCLLQVSGATFNENGGFDGGAIFTHPSPRTSHGISVISNSEFYENGGSNKGAAVYIVEGNFRIMNSLFISNGGLCAGAVCAEDEASLNVVNSTIVNNHGDIGGISATRTTTVVNSILWGNQSNVDPNIAQVSAGMAVQYSDIDQEGYEGNNGNIRVAPGFANVQGGNYRLSDSSQCINSGNNDAQFLPTDDLDGNSRIIDQRVDMGAYEKP